MKPVRDLLKHSSIYAVGQILTRMASILLLPLYTHCLTPTDYGITAILDLTTAILALVIGGGMVTAVTRFHFDNESEDHHDRVWWTGLLYVAGMSLVVLIPLWLARSIISDLTLGADQPDGEWFYTLTLLTIWAFVTGHVCDAYLRVRKWSGVFVMISLARLGLNVALNVWFLVFLQLGVEGLLLGNLISTVLHTATLLAVFVKTRGRACFDRPMARELIRFSMPLIVTAVLSMLIHEADRYILQMFVSLNDVGVYSLAHKIGFAVNTLCLMPFVSIWHVAIYDIERMPDSRNVFRQTFRWFVSGFGIVLLGAALIVHPVLPLLTPDAYGDSVSLVSVILLGFFFFGLQIQFDVPALLTKRSSLLVPGNVAGVVVNIVGNLILIPVMGVWGAAWAGVVTYAVCSFTILAMSRRVMTLSYPWFATAATLLGLCLTYLAVWQLVFPVIGRISEICVTAGVCVLWAVALFAKDGLRWWSGTRIRSSRESSQTPSPVPVSDSEICVTV